MTEHNKLLKRRGRTLSPPLSMRSYKLQSILDCNILLERVINAVLQGKIDSFTATKVAYMISVLYRGIELGKMEFTLEQLELRNYEENDA